VSLDPGEKDTAPTGELKKDNDEPPNLLWLVLIVALPLIVRAAGDGEKSVTDVLPLAPLA
jgi:hypothetical protein